MKYISFLFLLLILTSCSEKLKKEDLQGQWTALPKNYQQPQYSIIEFNDDNIYLTNYDSFKYSSKYEIDGKKIKFKEVNFQIEVSNDTSDLIYINGIKYQKSTDEYSTRTYDLVKIKSDKDFFKLNENYLPVHCYHDPQGVFRIRIGDKLISLKDLTFSIPPFHPHVKWEIVLFVDKNVRLQELKSVFYELLELNIRKANIIVDFRPPNEYKIFEDEIEIWSPDMNNYLLENNSPPIPNFALLNKDKSLKNGYVQIIIERKEDITNFPDLLQENTYLISINKDLVALDYIELKREVFDLRKQEFKIFTEILD